MKTQEINGANVMFIERDKKQKKDKHPKVPQGPIKQRGQQPECQSQYIKKKERTTLQKLLKSAPVSEQIGRIELMHLLSERGSENVGEVDFFEKARRIYSPKKL